MRETDMMSAARIAANRAAHTLAIATVANNSQPIPQTPAQGEQRMASAKVRRATASESPIRINNATAYG